MCAAAARSCSSSSTCNTNTHKNKTSTTSLLVGRLDLVGWLVGGGSTSKCCCCTGYLSGVHVCVYACFTGCAQRCEYTASSVHVAVRVVREIWLVVCAIAALQISPAGTCCGWAEVSAFCVCVCIVPCWHGHLILFNCVSNKKEEYWWKSRLYKFDFKVRRQSWWTIYNCLKIF